MDQRQEGRTKHTAEQTQTNGRTDRRRREEVGGWRDGEGGYAQFVSKCLGFIYDLPWRRREEQPAAPRRKGESREGSLVKWHFGNNTTKSLLMLLFPLWACLHAHSIHSLHPNIGIIQSTLSVCSLVYWFQKHLFMLQWKQTGREERQRCMG